MAYGAQWSSRVVSPVQSLSLCFSIVVTLVVGLLREARGCPGHAVLAVECSVSEVLPFGVDWVELLGWIGERVENVFIWSITVGTMLEGATRGVGLVVGGCGVI